MFAIGNISRFEGEKVTCKILKPVWDVITDYLVLFLAVLSIGMGGMQLTSGTFECLAVVHCPGMSISNMSDSFFSHVKYRHYCKAFYSSQTSNVIKGTDVVTDVKSSFQYINFVNSECSKIAVPNFLSYFGFVLFIQAFVLIVLDNLWLRLPVTASVIESFVSLVMECYASPCPNFALTHALSDLRHHADNQPPVDNNIEMTTTVSNDDSDIPVTMKGNESDNDESLDILEDPATISAIKSLYEKVDTLKKNVKSSRKIWQLYLLQAILQVVCAVTFLSVDIYYLTDLQETMTCTLSQHIPVVHANFICSHNLAPAFVLGLRLLYLPTLGITIFVYVFIIVWTVRKWKNKLQYVFDERRLPSLKATILSELPPVDQDLDFLLHLLHSYDKSYVVRFAHFLSRKSKKKMQAYSLRKKYKVSTLERQLKENGNELSFTDIPGIPETIFKLSTEIVTLEFKECKLQNDDFKDFVLLTSLRKLSIIKCRLKSIPEGILNIILLEELNLSGNLITKVNESIAKLSYLTTLDLSNNNLETIEPQSFENLDNLLTVYLSGNPKLKMEALKVVLACNRLRILYSPRHLLARKNELNRLEAEKFEVVNVLGSGSFVIPYIPDDAPHIQLGDHEKVYKMDSSPKGIAIIINNYSYQNCPINLRDRVGSEIDVAMLKSVFKKIGFDPVYCIDYAATRVEQFVEEYAKHEAYKDCDCIVVIVMSHGGERGLIFPNGECLDVMRLVKCVQKSPFYQGKPKLFFIQACRGDKPVETYKDSFAFNQSTMLSQHSAPFVCVDAWPPSSNDRKKMKIDASSSGPVMTTELPPIPEEADILLSYSTMHGHMSMRSLTHGSWYVNALVETLCEHAWEEDILSLLTLVNYKVIRAFSQAGWRQVPAPQSTLRKKLYLLPGYPCHPRSTESPQKNTYV